MALVTRPLTFTKGEDAVYTLDKTELGLLPEVSGDGYFSIESNWRTVSVVMKSAAGNQTKVLVFDATDPSPTAAFFATLKARDDFEVDRLTIFDFDKGTLTIGRVDLPTAEFDISSTPPEVGNLMFSANFDSVLTPQNPASGVTIASLNATISGGQVNFPTGNARLFYTLDTPLTFGERGGALMEITLPSTLRDGYVFAIGLDSAFENAAMELFCDSTGTVMKGYIRKFGGGSHSPTHGAHGQAPGSTFLLNFDWDFRVAGLREYAIYFNQVEFVRRTYLQHLVDRTPDADMVVLTGDVKSPGSNEPCWYDSCNYIKIFDEPQIMV